MAFIEQLELDALRDTAPTTGKVKDPLGTFPASSSNGNGKPGAVDDTPPRHIGEAIKKRDKVKT